MNLNRVQIIGNLTADPHYAENNAGAVFVTLSIATNQKWKGRDGRQNDEVEFHHVIAWESIAEAISAVDPKKGDLVMVEGRNRTRTYQDKNGNDVQSTEIVAHTFACLMTKTQAIKRSQYAHTKVFHG